MARGDARLGCVDRAVLTAAPCTVQVVRDVRKSKGVPPHRYVIDRRIDKAKRLLSDNYLPLVEVGLSVGFQNQSHFTTLFHKRTGLTPKAYRSRI